ncbi:MAG: toprim domain-containing protein [Pseudomonadota bacterium]
MADTVAMRASARGLTHRLGGRWYGARGKAACPVCQPERRPDQDALSLGQDGYRLLLYCHKSGCRYHDILAAAGIEAERTPPLSETERAALHRQRHAAHEAGIAAARAIWEASEPLAGSLAERYLRARAIAVARPLSLRFHPRCPLGSAAQCPAMVGAIVAEGGGLIGVQRTFLAEPGRKAGLAQPKLTLGSMAGGAVRLSAGQGPLVVAEGIETALSVLERLAGEAPRVWAALSAGVQLRPKPKPGQAQHPPRRPMAGMAGLHLPPLDGSASDTLIVASDNDAVGRKGAALLIARAEALGWHAQIQAPPEGHKDWNEAAHALVDEHDV